MFHIGDKVSCPLHGAGIIEDIISRQSRVGDVDYIVVRLEGLGLKITMPVSMSDSSNIRLIISPQKANELLCVIPQLEYEFDSNWTKRYRDNMDRLKTGDVVEIARVFKSLNERNKGKGLSAGERKMYHSAKQILVSELALSFECSKDEAEEKLCAVLLI